jgi:PAS domain S-box-containing protein
MTGVARKRFRIRLCTLASGGRGLLVSTAVCLLLSACHQRQQKAGPFIEFTKVPRSAEGNPYKLLTIEGRVTGAHTGQQIVLYARSGAWWVQPLADRPYTPIQPDSTWKNTTHPGTEYAALLVDPPYHLLPITIVLPATGGAVAAVAAVRGNPYFWQTWWFRSGAILALLAITFWMYRLRVRSIEERERHFRLLAENAPDIVMRFDSELVCRYVNPIIEEYTGLTSGVLLGKTIREVSAFDRRDRNWEASLRNVFETGKPATKDLTFDTPKGERHFESRLVPEGGTDGVTKSVLVVTRDITDRKHAESLLAGEKRILEMVAKGDSLADILDSLCRVVEERASGVLASILLLDGDRLRHGGGPSLPKAYTDAIDGAAIGPSAGSCGTAAYRGEQVIVEDIAANPLWANYRDLALPYSLRACWSTPVLSSKGKVIATFAMYYREPRSPSPRDQEIIEQITHLAGVAIERKLAEDALRRSEAYLAEAQSLTHVGSWACNFLTGQVFHLSDEALRFYGFDPSQGPVPFERLYKATHPEDEPALREKFYDAIHARRDYDLEYRIFRPDGSIRFLRSLGHHSPSGEIGEYIGITMDITERKYAEAERERLRQLEADLAHVTRMTSMGELTASLAHEINQPIAAAITNANTCLRWLKRDPPDVEEAREAASRGVQAASRAAEIIKRIRVLFTKGASQWEPVDLNEVIREMVALLAGEAGRNFVVIRTELAADIPKAMADRVQLQQVFANLMLNAIQAMKGISVAAELTIRSRREGNGNLLVSVSDTGAGFTPEQADQIFRAFYTTKPDGTGMGLAISRSIIESHGGRLWATANPGPGATFQFTLPIESEAS